MNKLRKRLLSSTIFFVILVSFVSLSGIWNPFKKESWEELGEDIKKEAIIVEKGIEKEAIIVEKEIEKAVEVVSAGLKKPEPKIKGWAVRPTASTKLHEFVWVCTHNAFCSSAHKYGPYRQQDVGMVNQLKAGVRALMLDVWTAKGKVRLTHGPPKYDKLLRPLTFTEGMEFVKELKIMNKEFFDKDRKAVVFFILEDHVENRALLTKAFESAGLSGKILKPSEWNPIEKKGWPTIGWMNKRGKQIVVFRSGGPETKYVYKRSRTIVANHWDNELDIKEASVVDVNKYERYLYLFNFFEDPASKLKLVKDPIGFFRAAGGFIKGINYSDVNNRKLRNAIYYAITQGPMVTRDRYPNFLAVDFVEKGNALGIADELNIKARGKQSKVFRVITVVKEEEEVTHKTTEHTGSWY